IGESSVIKVRYITAAASILASSTKPTQQSTTMSTTPQVIEYRGNCHCGAFKFTYKAAELKQAFTCNCSICSKNGYLWAFPAKQEDFTVFCPTCGTSVLGRTVDGRCGINVLIFDSLPVLASDGAATEPSAPLTNVYHGSCHCGAVGYTLLSLDKITSVKDCG
ncbi:hypothetical protein K438DRAFT_1848898, partial [Mycena galopus ATCC 62051]